MQIKTTRDIYSKVPKQEPPIKPEKPANQDELLAKTMEHLAKIPQIAQRIK